MNENRQNDILWMNWQHALKLTASARARTIGNANELTRMPIVRKIAVSMQGELAPPAPSVCRLAIIVGSGLRM